MACGGEAGVIYVWRRVWEEVSVGSGQLFHELLVNIYVTVFDWGMSSQTGVTAAFTGRGRLGAGVR